MSELVHKGSTKDVYRQGPHYLFHFSDRYSVFDWGEMPDQLKGKGEALAEFAKCTYEHLEKKGLATHRVTGGAEKEYEGKPYMLVRPFKVIRDVKIMPQEENIFVPLEVIFRLGVAAGSSLLKKGYKENERFSSPMVEFTTKLERFDRPLTHEEAKELAGLSDVEWDELLRCTVLIAHELESLFASVGVTLWDGKVEFALGKKGPRGREIILVDSIGPDELRISLQGVQLSKEIIRQYYRKTEWYKNLDEVKKLHGEEFKKFITAPASLPSKFKLAVEEMYLVLPQLLRGVSGSRERLDALLSQLKETSI